MAYSIYPAVDNVTLEFPPEIITALSKTEELRSTIIPMTQTQRNDLSGLNLWDGRLVFNLSTKKINRYDLGALAWYEIDKDVRTDPLTLPGAPTLDLHAATKKYVDEAHPGRNKLINGSFIVNQRNATGATTGTYSVDRWKFWGNAPQGTATCSVIAATLGELPESSTRYIRLATNGQTAAAASSLLRQHIEDVRTLSGKAFTVSFWAKAAAGTPSVAVSPTQGFGSGGSPSAAVVLNGQKVAITTTWTRYSLTFTMPSIAGKTIGTDVNSSSVTIDLWTSAGTDFNVHTNSLGIQNTTIDFWGIQVEEGLVATPFEQKSYADELSACRRYYQQSMPSTNSATGLQGYAENFAIFSNRAAGSVMYWGHLPLKVQMRAVPTIKLYSYNGTVDRVSTGASGAGDLVYDTLVQWGDNMIGFNIATAGTTHVHACWTASAEY